VDDFILRVPSSGFLNRRLITFQPDAMRNAQLSQCWGRAAAHVQNAVASKQRLSQGQFDLNLRRVSTVFQQRQRQMYPAFHFLWD
jgi:hypothetical protein